MKPQFFPEKYVEIDFYPNYTKDGMLICPQPKCLVCGVEMVCMESRTVYVCPECKIELRVNK